MKVGSLDGRTILVASSEGRVASLVAAIEALGGIAIPFPTVRLVPPPDLESFERALRNWASYDWIVFTSAAAVDAVTREAGRIGLDLRLLPGKVAVVGPATAKAVEAAGLPVTAMPAEYLTDSLAAALGDIRGKSVFLPRSRIARKGLADDLRSGGAKVVEVDAYDAASSAPDLASLSSSDRIDFVVFTSASTVRQFVSLVPHQVLERVRTESRIACIGPVTAEAADESGLRASIVATEHTIPGLVRALAEVVADE
jgi:uroporphyrinogen-III synthase